MPNILKMGIIYSKRPHIRIYIFSFNLTRFSLDECVMKIWGFWFSNRFSEVNHLMLDKMMSFIEMNTSFMFQYMALLQNSKVQYGVKIKTIQYLSTSIKSACEAFYHL